MVCTNRCGWPGYRWGRGPNWATTGVIRPVTEVARSVLIAVHDMAGLRTHQQLVDAAAPNQSAQGAVRCGAAVVDLAGRKPPVRHHQLAAIAGALVGQHRPNRTYRRIRNRAPERAPPHAAFHRGHVEVFDHDAAIAARQLGGELVGSFPAQMHAPAVQPGQLGFRCPVTARSRDAAGKFTPGSPPRHQGGFERPGACSPWTAERRSPAR